MNPKLAVIAAWLSGTAEGKEGPEGFRKTLPVRGKGKAAPISCHTTTSFQRPQILKDFAVEVIDCEYLVRRWYREMEAESNPAERR